MPHQSDNPDHPSTLPQPDLNPLINPVLAKNIGRWAEVYFTNPPEKRECAVQELVRELERENLSPADAFAPQPLPRQRDAEEDNRQALSSAGIPVQGLTCHSCGYVNRPRHKFCGRCGMKIAPVAVDGAEEQEPQTDFPVPSPSPESRESPVFGHESTPRWQAYRLYAGVALALVVLVLGYMAWRGTKATAGTSHTASLAPPAVTGPVASTSAPSNLKAEAPSHTPLMATPAAPAETSPRTPASASGKNGAEASGANGGGSEELAVARDFLNGTNGKERNPAQAVPLLWKAIGKENAYASVLLAGMYLRGDGVSRNCEQARLLLDAAAVKGRKDAAELLRNLQAFGCQ